MKDLLSFASDVLVNESGILPSFGVKKVQKLHVHYVHPEQRRFQGPSTFAEAIYSLFLEFGGFKQHVKNQQ